MNATQQALHNATTSPSMANYGAIYSGFAAKGIDDVRPRENVFTFAAWQALGRQVKSGEHGVSITTWIPMTKRDDNGEAQSIGRKPRTTTVFHVSQTQPRAGYSEALWQYALAQGVDGEVKHDAALNVDTGHCAVPPSLLARVTELRQQRTDEYYSTEFTPIA